VGCWDERNQKLERHHDLVNLDDYFRDFSMEDFLTVLSYRAALLAQGEATMKKTPIVKLSLALALIIANTFPVFAQSKTYTDTYPISGILSAECSSEPVAVTGSIETDTIEQFNGSTMIVQFHTKDAGASGIGTTSGIQYKVKMNEYSKWMFDSGVMDITHKNKFTLQGPGPDNDTNFTYFSKMTYEDGEFHVKFEKFSEYCK
jgi:hypothetical protein